MEKFTCFRDKNCIKGAYFKPSIEKEKYPAIIISHGFKGNYLGEIPYGEAFSKLGYAAFCFSFCGGACKSAPDEAKSDGKDTDCTIQNEVEDLLAVKDYVKTFDWVDKDNIIFLGSSQGGMVSGLAAARAGDEIKNLIMIYPALCIPDHARRGILGGASYDVANVPEIIPCGDINISKAFHDGVVSMDVFKELSKYKGRVLILQGLEDQIVDFTYAIRANASYKKGQSHLQLIPEMGHGQNDEQRRSMVASVNQFLQGHEEILTIRVLCTHTDCIEKENAKTYKIYFTGYCKTDYFEGTVVNEGCDTTTIFDDGRKDVRAEYTLTGFDKDNKVCELQIVNKNVGDEWKPTVQTENENLKWLSESDLTAVLDMSSRGPVVRIFADKKYHV